MGQLLPSPRTEEGSQAAPDPHLKTSGLPVVTKLNDCAKSQCCHIVKQVVA